MQFCSADTFNHTEIRCFIDADVLYIALDDVPSPNPVMGLIVQKGVSPVMDGDL